MPFSGVVFTNVTGASSAAPGLTVQSTVWNNIHIDYEAAFTQLNAQYASVSTNRNVCWMNGGLEVWQRGAGDSASIAVAASAGNPYTADRWYLQNGANQASTVAAITGLVANSRRCARVGRNAGQTGTGLMLFCYPLDTDEIAKLVGNFAAISMILKAGAGFNNGSVTVELVVGPGAPDKTNTSGQYSGGTTAYSLTTTLSSAANTLVSGTTSAIIPTNTLQAEIHIKWTPSGTASADETIYIDDVSVQPITSSYSWTPMNYDRVPFPTMLIGCMSHFQKTFDYNTAPANATTAPAGAAPGSFTSSFGGLIGIVNSSGGINMPWTLPVRMRKSPFNASAFSNSQVFNPVFNSNSAYVYNTSVSVVESSPGVMPTAGEQSVSFQLQSITNTVNTGSSYMIYMHAYVTAGI